MTAYKLTNQNMTTYNDTKWEVGVKKTTDGSGELCGPGWLHCYDDPVLAIMLNPIHAKIDNPRLWLVEVGGDSKHDRGLKIGYTEMTLVEERPVPKVSTGQRIYFSILCAKEVYKDATWNVWADGWLSAVDRSAAYAHDAAYSAYAAYSASSAAAAYAANANAAYAAYAAANAANANAAYAANAANANAAYAANAAADTTDLIALAHRAMAEYKEAV
jgi:hypothetical protein